MPVRSVGQRLAAGAVEEAGASRLSSVAAAVSASRSSRAASAVAMTGVSLERGLQRAEDRLRC